VHAAGVLADGIVTEMTLDQLDRAMSPKVRGAWNLHTATRDMPLDFFVLFSISGQRARSPGQANICRGQRVPGRARPRATGGRFASGRDQLGSVGGQRHGG